MPEDDDLERRLAAVERALDDAESAGTPGADTLRERVDALEADVGDLEAAVQAVRGYVGGVKHVNDEVEQRAEAALAKAEAVERSMDDRATGRPSGGRGSPPLDARGHGATTRDHDEPAGAAETPPGRCPQCGAPSSGHASSPRPGDGQSEGARASDRGNPPEARSGVPDGGEPSGRRSTDPAAVQRSDDAVPGAPMAEPHRHTAGLGERTVGAAGDEEPAGLLARLREVL